jgi:hypothetical protein
VSDIPAVSGTDTIQCPMHGMRHPFVAHWECVRLFATPQVPPRFMAEAHSPGCLPDAEPTHYDTAADAWSALIETLDVLAEDLMWEPSEPSDPTGPHQRSAFALSLEQLITADRPGVVSGPDGYNYEVTDTYTVTCGECGFTFPDLYPSGRCPYEYHHDAIILNRLEGELR